MAIFANSIDEFLGKLPKNLAEKIKNNRLNGRIGKANLNYQSVQDLINDLPKSIKSELGDYLYYRKGLKLDLTPVISRNDTKNLFDENRKIPKRKNFEKELDKSEDLCR